MRLGLSEKVDVVKLLLRGGVPYMHELVVPRYKRSRRYHMINQTQLET